MAGEIQATTRRQEEDATLDAGKRVAVNLQSILICYIEFVGGVLFLLKCPVVGGWDGNRNGNIVHFPTYSTSASNR